MKKLFAFVLFMLLCIPFAACGGSLEWPNTRLGNVIPQMENVKGEIGYSSMDTLHISLEGVSETQYAGYVDACKAKGFTIDIVADNDSFVAFNSEGYKIDLSYFSKGDMWIYVDAPVPMGTFTWPASEIAKLIPAPESNFGKIEWEGEHGFVIYVGNMTKEQYSEYVNSVYELGFSVDYKRGDDYFWADNSDGYKVEIRYKGFNTVFIRMDEPKKENDNTDNGGLDDPEGDSENGESGNNNEELIDGMRPSFKEAMDAYESFMNEYCSFMKEYNSSTDTLGMLQEYLDFLEQYTEMLGKLQEIENQNMNAAELVYYTKITNRVAQKLLELNQ